jgi:hypothetical protein
MIDRQTMPRSSNFMDPRQQKESFAYCIQLVDFSRAISPQTMRRKFFRILFVVLAVFAMFAFVYPDDLSEDDSACSQSEMLQVSPVKIPTHRDQQGLVVDSPRLFAAHKRARSLSSSGRTTPPTLLSLAACVLRC